MTWDVKAIPDIFTHRFVTNQNYNFKHAGLEPNAEKSNTQFRF